MDRKYQLRLSLSARLQSIDVSEWNQAETEINQKLRFALRWSTVTRVYIYDAQPHLHEIRLGPFMEWLSLTHPYVITEIAEVHQNAKLPTTQFDVIILPLVGFDNSFNRLGRGAGWYDKLLQTQQNTIKIAVAHSSQQVDAIPTEAHDQKVDLIITEEAIQSTR